MKQYEKVVELSKTDNTTIQANVVYISEREAIIGIQKDSTYTGHETFDYIVLDKEQIKTLYELSIGKQ
jgi:ribonuclease PH